jgi:hypothetical protein
MTLTALPFFTAFLGIEPLLDTVFSFLRRKTDFFAGPPGSEDGSAAAIAKVNQVLQKHAAKYQADKAPKKPKTTPTKTKASPKKETKAPPKKETKPTQQLPPKKKEDDVIEMTDDGFDISNAPAAVEPAVVVAATEAVQKEESSKVAGKKEGDKDDDDVDQNAPSPIGNGGQVPGKFVWTQTLAEVSLTIPVPDNTRGKDLNVTIGRNHLKVGMRDGTKTWIVDSPLTKTVIVDDSFCTIEDGSRLVINLQKLGQMEWWDSVCQDDPKIDVRKIQPENSNLGDLDGETRTTVEKMMFDQRQKALGLPSSEEQTKFDALAKFKKQHPELDFSNAKIS